MLSLVEIGGKIEINGSIEGAVEEALVLGGIAAMAVSLKALIPKSD